MRKSNLFLTVDIVLFKKTGPQIEVLLIQRKNPPFQHCWALPGGYVDADEDPDFAAVRELKEETHLSAALEQLRVFGKPGRDPRGHVVSVAYTGWVGPEAVAKADDDAAQVAWFSLNQLPDLAFDHQKIINCAVQKYL